MLDELQSVKRDGAFFLNNRYDALAQPFLYTGREWEPGAELYHYRARAYDPSTGRFYQEDPIGFAAGDPNIYRYVGSNPLNWSDPSGLAQTAEGAIIRAGIIGVAIRGAVAVGSRGIIRTGLQAARISRATESALQRTGSGTACGLFTVADAMAHAGADTIIVDGGRCGVTSIANNGNSGESDTGSASGSVSAAATGAGSAEAGEGDDDPCDPNNDPSGDLKRLTRGDIKRLQEGGINIHAEKHAVDGSSRQDLFKDTCGDIFIRNKDGSGEAEKLFININDIL